MAENTEVTTSATENSDVVSKTAERLEALFGEEVSTDEPGQETQASEETEQTTEGEEQTEQQTTEGTEESKEGEAESAQTQEAGKAAATETKTDAPTLPAAYRRSLKAMEWTDAEIDANLKTYGPKFIETAEKIHRTRNAETQQWAAMGRQMREQQGQQGVETKPAAKTEPEVLKELDEAELKEEYGDDAVVAKLVGPVNAMIKKINAIMPQISEFHQKAQTSELETLGRQIDGFFRSKDLEGYAELFGDPAKTLLTDQQQQARNKVIDYADMLVAGAAKQGRKLSLDQALLLAVDATSGDFKEKLATSKIKKTLTQRQKGITLRPGARKVAESANKPLSRAELEQKTKARLAAAFK